MKCSVFLIAIQLISTQISAQITVTGASTAGANTTYTLGTAATVQVFNSDAGTNLYSDIPYNPPMPSSYTIYRMYRGR